jgi:hypothetical protein
MPESLSNSMEHDNQGPHAAASGHCMNSEAAATALARPLVGFGSRNIMGASRVVGNVAKASPLIRVVAAGNSISGSALGTTQLPAIPREAMGIGFAIYRRQGT